MKTFVFACLLGIAALISGLFIFGRVGDEKISLNTVTYENVNSPGKAWVALKNQPTPVFVCGGVGFAVGGLAYLMYSIRCRRDSGDSSWRKKGKDKKKGTGLPGLEIVPKSVWNESNEKTDLDKFESQRPVVCRILGFATLGVLKFYAVPQGNVLVVTTFGKFRKLCNPGLGCMLSFWGFYQRPYSDMPLIQCKETTVPYERESVVTSDGIRCKLDVMICYKIDHPGKALFEVDNYKKAIDNVVRAILRNECGRVAAPNLRASREIIVNNLKSVLEKDTAPWGIKVRMVKVSNIEISAQEGDNKFDSVFFKENS
jgi:hypothetical protein